MISQHTTRVLLCWQIISQHHIIYILWASITHMLNNVFVQAMSKQQFISSIVAHETGYLSALKKRSKDWCWLDFKCVQSCDILQKSKTKWKLAWKLGSDCSTGRYLDYSHFIWNCGSRESQMTAKISSTIKCHRVWLTASLSRLSTEAAAG